MNELYRDFIDGKADAIINSLGGTITPAPANAELYRDFLDRKFDDVITALNGVITPTPEYDELYRDFIERKFDDVIAGIGGYVPPVTFPTLTGSIVTFNSQHAGLPLKSHVVDVDYTGSAVSGLSIFAPQNKNLLGGQTFAEGFSSCQNYSIDTVNKTFTFARSGNALLKMKWKENTQYTIVLSAFSVIKNASACFVYTDDTRSPTFVIDERTKTEFRFVSEAGKTIDYVRVGWFEDGLVTAYYDECGIFEGNFQDAFIPYGGNEFNVSFPTAIYGGSYNTRTGILTSNKASDGSDIAPIDYQCATANIETILGVNNIWADTGDTTLQYIKIGGNT